MIRDLQPPSDGSPLRFTYKAEKWAIGHVPIGPASWTDEGRAEAQKETGRRPWWRRLSKKVGQGESEGEAAWVVRRVDDSRATLSEHIVRNRG